VPRVVSLLPSATETVCAVGGLSDLVGVSHECDHPPEVASLPAVTRSKAVAGPTSLEIDRSVRDVVRSALGVYDVDVDALRDLSPDVVVTQNLCDVCAVSLDDVRAAVKALARRDVAIVSLTPTQLADVLEDVPRVGRAIGRAAAADRVAADMRARIEAVRARAEKAASRPSVLTIEWIEPVMLGGTWMPELVEIAGGRPLVTKPGDKAPTVGLDALAAMDPDVVVVKPCGFDVERTLREIGVLARVLPWTKWRCARASRVFVADGNAYFNRPGPRIADSLEILAACVHPALFADFRARYAGAVRRVAPDLSAQDW